MTISIYQNISSMEDVILMGAAFARSGMFGCSNEEQGTVFALQCLAEGIPPLEIAKKYHLVKGKLTMRADAMLAEFRKADGDFRWHDLKNEKVQKATVVWEDQEIEVEYSMDQAMKAGAAKKNAVYGTHPAAMLRARLVAETLRAIAPEILQGTYVPEEITDDDPLDHQETIPAKKVAKPKPVKMAEDPTDDVPTDYKEPVSFEISQKLESYWKALSKTEEAKAEAFKFVGNPKALGFASLTADQAGKLVSVLQKQMNELAEKKALAPEGSSFGETQDAPEAAKEPEKAPEPDQLLKPLVELPSNVSAWLQANEEAANAYMHQIKWIIGNETWRNMPQGGADKMLARLPGFAKAAGIPPMEGVAA